MPSWGRPPGGRGVGRYMEEAEDVYRFMEVDSEDEKQGVLLDSGYQNDPNDGQNFNSDELYFNGMDIRAWERRSVDLDGLAYGDDYGYVEDEGYYEDAGDLTMAIAEHEDLLFQRVLDKIRLARVTGDPDVQLTSEELEIYQARLSGQRAPAVRPQISNTRHASAPVVSSSTSTAVASTPSTVGAPESSSGRAKKSSRRTSLFGSRRPKDKDKDKDKDKGKTSSRTRAPSMSSEASNQPHPPSVMMPGSNGQPAFAPINTYHGRMAQDARIRVSSLPPHRSLQSASVSTDRLATSKTSQSGDPKRTMQTAYTPRDMPGTFPSDSPQTYRSATPPQLSRPTSSSSRQSTYNNADSRHIPNSRPQSSSSQQATKLVPLAVPEYKHHTAEPFQYQMAGHLATSQSQPQYTRRIVPGSANSNYTSMPRRVPVPVQHATGVNGVQGSYSDPAIVPKAEVSEMDEDAEVLVDVVPSTDDKSYKAQTSKSTTKGGSSGGSVKDGERRKKSSRTRRKH